MEVLNKITEDLEDAARQHISKIFYWHINQLRGNSQSGLCQLKIGLGPQLVIRKALKRDGQKHFENVPNYDRVMGKDIVKDDKACDTLDVKEYLFCEERLMAVSKGREIIRPQVLIVFFKYIDYEVIDKLLKIMNMILKKEKYLVILIKLLYKKGDKSECGNYRDISLVSVESRYLKYYNTS